MHAEPRVAIVTGGSRGIGRAIVDRLLADGLDVITCGRGDRPVDLALEARWLTADVSKPSDALRLVQHAVESVGSVDVLVNNAGVQVEKSVVDSSDADWDAVIDTNCRGVFNLCRAAIPEMSARGGSIVNIASTSASVADPGMALYNASKAFVVALTRSIAVDHGPHVRCNAVSPGWIETDMAGAAFAVAADTSAARADAVHRHPAGRLGSPDDVAGLVAWLASAEAAWVTGQQITIDGGMTARSPIDPTRF